MDLFYADCRENKNNTIYQNKATLQVSKNKNEENLIKEIFSHDYVCAEYSNYSRSIKNFLRADCLGMDVDNNFSDNPDDWITPDDICDKFPDVSFIVHCSRHHMVPKKEKDGYKEPRPKFHVLFPVQETTDSDFYIRLKETLYRGFPAFDVSATDAARFFYGTETPEVQIYYGTMTIDEFLIKNNVAIEHGKTNKNKGKELDTSGTKNVEKKIVTGKNRSIPEGTRNATLVKRSAQILKRLGDTTKAYSEYLAVASLCDPPLPDNEVAAIWENALKFYHSIIEQASDYIQPSLYNTQNQNALVPADQTDVGEATVFAKIYRETVRYTEATGWLIYDGTVWKASDIEAQGLVQKLTRQQLDFARTLLKEAQKQEDEATVADNRDAQEIANKQIALYIGFRKFVLDRRKSPRIVATMTEARPMLHISVDELDKDPYLLNTPDGTVNLKTGVMQKHDPRDYCTKITSVAPNEEGMALWLDFLNQVTCGDAELIRYLQEIAGMFCVGKVLKELLVIAYGNGGNGKSTYFNVLIKVLNNYAGGLSSDVLIVNARGNKKPELAELRGMRLVIAAELDEGTRLDTAMVKKLCSTDPVRGEAKYKAPFTFIPSHSTVLYSNHLPRVGASDSGTWSRLLVIPFDAHFRGKEGEVLNYADYLFEHAGGAILTWMIDGAKKFIAQDGNIRQPECVRIACEDYKEQNDWLSDFLDDRCDIADDYSTYSSILYTEYSAFCEKEHNYKRSKGDFRGAMENAGFEYKRGQNGMRVIGIRVKSSS